MSALAFSRALVTTPFAKTRHAAILPCLCGSTADIIQDNSDGFEHKGGGRSFVINTVQKEMNELDFENLAVWPFEIKTVVALVLAVIVGVLSYHLIISAKLPVLDKAELDEVELKRTFEAKYRIAVNLEAYQQQLERIEQDFSSMLKSLPTMMILVMRRMKIMLKTLKKLLLLLLKVS